MGDPSTKPSAEGIECPLESLKTAVTLHPRDWSEHHRDAWAYGIIVGWGRALDEVAQKHGWTPETVARLKRLHRKLRTIRRTKR